MARRRNNNTRRERGYRRLGTRNPVCVICGESDPSCLELHHIAGHAHHDDVAIVCRNCHRKLSDEQLDHQALVKRGALEFENAALGLYLLGLAELLPKIGQTLGSFGLWSLNSNSSIETDNE